MIRTYIVSKALLRGTIILALLILSLQAIPAFGFVINQDPFSNLADEYKGLYSSQEYKQITLERINYHRELAGLPKVSLNEKLSSAAQAHADYLNINGYVGHDEDPGEEGFTGQYAQNRAEHFGYDWGSVGEVISFGYTASDGVDALMAAIYHRFIILNPDFLEVG
ncbi:MAG: CAP domain-containing protein, partial [Desulfatiglandales bacterium]